MMHLLVHASNAFGSWGWASWKSGALNSIWFSPGVAHVLELSAAASQGAHKENGKSQNWEQGWHSNLTNVLWDVGVPSCTSTATPSIYSRNVYFIKGQQFYKVGLNSSEYLKLGIPDDANRPILEATIFP